MEFLYLPENLEARASWIMPWEVLGLVAQSKGRRPGPGLAPDQAQQGSGAMLPESGIGKEHIGRPSLERSLSFQGGSGLSSQQTLPSVVILQLSWQWGRVQFIGAKAGSQGGLPGSDVASGRPVSWGET